MDPTDKNKTMAGVTVLMIYAMVAVVMVATSVAAGCAFGAAYGFLALAAWAGIAAVVLIRALYKITNEGRDDG